MLARQDVGKNKRSARRHIQSRLKLRKNVSPTDAHHRSKSTMPGSDVLINNEMLKIPQVDDDDDVSG